MGRAGPARPMKNEPNGFLGRVGTICTVKYIGAVRSTGTITVYTGPARLSKCSSSDCTVSLFTDFFSRVGRAVLGPARTFATSSLGVKKKSDRKEGRKIMVMGFVF